MNGFHTATRADGVLLARGVLGGRIGGGIIRSISWLLAASSSRRGRFGFHRAAREEQGSQGNISPSGWLLGPVYAEILSVFGRFLDRSDGNCKCNACRNVKGPAGRLIINALSSTTVTACHIRIRDFMFATNSVS